MHEIGKNMGIAKISVIVLRLIEYTLLIFWAVLHYYWPDYIEFDKEHLQSYLKTSHNPVKRPTLTDKKSHNTQSINYIFLNK